MKKLFKSAGLVLDCYSDPNFVSHIEAQKRFGSELVAPEELSTLSDKDFAIKVASYSGYKRYFPIYNPLVTSISCRYLEANKHDLPTEIVKSAEYHLAKACELHGIEKAASLESVEECDHVVSYVTYNITEKELEAQELSKKAEEMVSDQLHKLPPKGRSAIATDLVKSAGFENLTRTNVWDYVEKPLAGPLFLAALDDREVLLKRASSYDLVEVLDDIRNNQNDTEAPILVNLIEEFDKLAGFTDRYKDGFIDPYKAVYGGHPLPCVMMELKQAKLQKQASPISMNGGPIISPHVSKEMTVEQHTHMLQERFPKNTAKYTEGQEIFSDVDTSQWGDTYSKATRIYFK